MKFLPAIVFLAAAATAAAQVKVSELPAASSLSGTEVFPVVQSGSKKATIAQVSNYTIAAATETFQAKNAKLTAFAALTDAAGVFVSDGAGNYSWLGYASTGLLADGNKLVQYHSTGGINANNFARVNNGTAYAGIHSNGFSGSKGGNLIFVNWPGSLTSTRTLTYPDASGVLYALGQPLTMGAGVPLSIAKTGHARAGNATLVAGTVTVSNTTVTANTLVILTVKTAGGTVGNLTYTLSAATSFTITSDNPLETSTVTYLLIENP